MRENEEPAIGIDVGGTHLRAALVSGRGRVLRRLVEPTPRSPQDTLETAARMAGQIVGTCPQEITTLGIAVAATLAGTHVSWSSQPALDNEHIGTHLATATGLRVTLINDARAAALAEARVGAGVGLPSILMITVGTGLGGGIVIGGRVFQGTDNAGEVGHVVIDPNGPPCPCGRSGCWERLAGGWAINAAARAEACSHPFGLTARAAAPDAATAIHLAHAADQGDGNALAIIQGLAHAFAIGLDNVCAILSPHRVVIGGGIMAKGGVVAHAYLAAAASLRWNRGDVVQSALGDDGGAIGAALHALDGR
jgi:glucokinase